MKGCAEGFRGPCIEDGFILRGEKNASESHELEVCLKGRCGQIVFDAWLKVTLNKIETHSHFNLRQ